MHEGSTTSRPRDHTGAPRLLAVAHGTVSVDGRATIARLVAAIAAARPDVRVELCFLDVAGPFLADALDESPTVVVPMLLSTGYHVRSDIPDAVAEHRATVVARHLGPHPLLVDAIADRLPAGPAGAATVVLGAGSSRAEARVELDATAALLGQRLGSPVDVLTMADDLPAELRRRAPVRVATYLLAEGRFTETLAAAADGVASVGPPLGVHPAIVELVWTRYDEAVARGGRAAVG